MFISNIQFGPQPSRVSLGFNPSWTCPLCHNCRIRWIRILHDWGVLTHLLTHWSYWISGSAVHDLS